MVIKDDTILRGKRKVVFFCRQKILQNIRLISRYMIRVAVIREIDKILVMAPDRAQHAEAFFCHIYIRVKDIFFRCKALEDISAVFEGDLRVLMCEFRSILDNIEFCFLIDAALATDPIERVIIDDPFDIICISVRDTDNAVRDIAGIHCSIGICKNECILCYLFAKSFEIVIKEVAFLDKVLETFFCRGYRLSDMPCARFRI